MRQWITQRVVILAAVLIVASLHPCWASSDKATKDSSAAKAPLEQARELLQKKQFADASRVLTDFLQGNSGHQDSAEARFLLGRTQIQEKAIDRAFHTFNLVTRNYSGTEWAARSHAEIAKLHELRRNRVSAQRERDVLLNSYPQSPTTLKVWGGVADQFFNEANYTKAAEIYQILDASLDQAQKKKFKLSQALAMNEGNPAQLLASGDEALKSNDLETAASLFEMYIERFPTGPGKYEAKTKLGWSKYRVPDPKSKAEAEAIWLQVVKEGPATDEWVGRAKWHLVQLLAGPRGEWKKAVVMCDELIATFPRGSFRHEQAMLSKAWLFWVHKNWQPALEGFETLMQNYPATAMHAPILEYVADCREKLGISSEE